MARIVFTPATGTHDHDPGTHIPDVTGGVTSDGEARATIALILDLLETLGFMEAS